MQTSAHERLAQADLDAEVVASERERQRIAHDLHDGLGQLLGGIALKAEVLHQTLAEKGLAEAEAAAELVKLANEATDQTRVLARGLDPAIPPQVPFAATLDKLARETSRLFRGVTCTFRGDVGLAIESQHITQHLFRIAQEALNNAIRHGRATRLELDLAADERDYTLCVYDNGTGNGKPSVSSGIGLRIMKHRANALGGILTLEPGGKGGTVVCCRVPRAPTPTP